MNDPVRAVTLTAQRYAETFGLFVQRSHEYPAMVQSLTETRSRLPEGFSVLDIGAGTGMLTHDWLAPGSPRCGRYVAIEPDPSHVSQLREVVTRLDLSGEILAEPFHAEFPAPGTFDLILFSHSLYWMRDPIACLEHACQWLAPGGRLLIFIQGPFGFYTLFHLFNPLLKRNVPSGPDHGLSSHEIVQGLRASRLPATVSYAPTTLDLTGLFDTGAEHERDEFLSFILQVEFAQIAEPLKSDILQCARACCADSAGRLLLHHPNVTIEIPRAS